MFQFNQNGTNAMGSALKAAHKLISPIGGKVVCLMASLPNVATGKLTPRDNAGAAGTSKEAALLQAQNTFYKSFAVECSKHQVSIDMFLFSSNYQDVASLSCLPRYTGGQTFYYPGWNAGRAGVSHGSLGGRPAGPGGGRGADRARYFRLVLFYRFC